MDKFLIKKTTSNIFEKVKIFFLTTNLSHSQVKILQTQIQSAKGQSAVLEPPQFHACQPATDEINVIACADTLTAETLPPKLPLQDIVRVQWIQDSLKCDQRLPLDEYLIISPSDYPSKKQKLSHNPPIKLKWTKDQDSSLLILAVSTDAQDVTTRSDEIVAFDLDSTLISTKSGKTFAQDAQDWKWWSSHVPHLLRQLTIQEKKLVIFSNQIGILKGQTTEVELKTKLEAIVRALDAPIVVYLSLKDDLYRKPRTSAWTHMITHYNEGHEPDKNKCCYVGDAAGRKKQGKRKKDFSASDYKFALNLQIPFATPEEYFAKSKDPLHTDRSVAEIGLDPRKLAATKTNPLFTPADTPLPAEDQELIVLCGPPGSGKSSFSKQYLKDYEWINQDTLKTAARCKSACKAALAASKSVVIDATNRDRKTRGIWVDIAKEMKVPCRCFHFDYEKDLVFHLNKYRDLQHRDDPNHQSISRVVIHTFFKYQEAPTIAEGFTSVAKVNFVLTDAAQDASLDVTSFLM